MEQFDGGLNIFGDGLYMFVLQPVLVLGIYSLNAAHDAQLDDLLVLLPDVLLRGSHLLVHAREVVFGELGPPLQDVPRVQSIDQLQLQVADDEMFGRDTLGLDSVQLHCLPFEDEVLDVFVVHEDELGELAQQIELLALVWDFVVQLQVHS